METAKTPRAYRLFLATVVSHHCDRSTVACMAALRGKVVKMQMQHTSVLTTFSSASVDLHIKGAVQRWSGSVRASDGDGGCSLPELRHVLAAVGHL